MNILQRIGAALMAVGMVGALYFLLFFNVSAARALDSQPTPLVSTPPGDLRAITERVSNLDLMGLRQTGATVSGLFAVVGAILLTNPISLSAARRPMPDSGRQRKVTGGFECPSCGLISPATAQRCDCGYKFT